MIAVEFDESTRRVTSQFTVTQPWGGLVIQDVIKGEAYVTQDMHVVAVPEAPSISHVWDWTSKTWVFNLPAARAQAWDRIKAARNGAEFGTFTWNGLVFDGDSESQRRIQGAAQLAAMAIAANVPWSIAWTLADNTTITMSAADMIAAGTSLAVSVAGAHNVARALRTQIDAATTQEELDAIVWPGGEL